MGNVMKHKHHILPKRLGGTDDSSNLIELTIEEHAEAHRVLYEQYGQWQDRLAYLGLLGMIGREEIIRTAQSEGGKLGIKALRAKPGFIQFKHSPERWVEIRKAGAISPNHNSKRLDNAFKSGKVGRLKGRKGIQTQLARGIHASQTGKTSFFTMSKAQRQKIGRVGGVVGVRKQLKSGKHPSQLRIKCLDHSIEGGFRAMKRWHRSCSVVVVTPQRTTGE